MTNIQPRIYVACLASYNNGILHGAWINANQTTDEIQDAINDFLKSSPMPNAEEWAVHDSEYLNFSGEHPSIEEIAEAGEFVSEHGEIAYELMVNYNGDIPRAKETLENHYHGEWESERAYIENYIDDTGVLDNCPDELKFYFDYDAYTRDAFICDLYSIYVNGKHHVFSNH